MQKTRNGWKRVLRKIIITLVALPVVLAVIAILQIIFFPVSKEEAIIKANHEFHERCHSEGLNPDAFDGPSVIPVSGNSILFSGGYFFTWWYEAENGETFSVYVTVDRAGCEESTSSDNIQKLQLRPRL
jgi:hypothetical protein